MTTTSWTTNPVFTTSAQFRTVGTNIRTALTAIGLVRTSDTGQVNWTSVAIPSGASVIAGYEIWKFNDSAQTTYPIVFKLEYGSTSVSQNYLGITLTVGTGSSGAGAITGVLYPALPMGYSASGVGTNSYASSWGSGFAAYIAAGSCTVGFGIERSLDATGAATGNGVLVVGSDYSNTTTANWYVVPYTDPSTYVCGFCPILPPTNWSGSAMSPSSTLSKDGATAPIFPIPIACPGVPPWISKQFMVLAPGDAGTFTASPYGTALTYKGLPLSAAAPCPVGVSAEVPAAIYWQ